MKKNSYENSNAIRLFASTLAQRDYKDATDLVVEKQKRKYIVRRLTPLECCRLQGLIMY